MKFLCDRCKTRYSIADERVRGKILKIRCKNCSNVIAVREGMPEPEAEAPAAAEARRQVRPTDFTPSVMAASPLQTAFAQVMQKPAAPPSQLEEEWYVSIDGDQSGPFSLPEAQTWVGAKKGDDELFCWCEGFDDWLPVEKVSHFRGLRVKPRVSAPTGAPPSLAGSPSRPPPARPAEDEPKPLFAAALAALEADVAADKPKAPPAGPGLAAPRPPPASSLPPPRPTTPTPPVPRTTPPVGSPRPPLPAARPLPAPRAKPATSSPVGLFDQSESEPAPVAAAAAPMFEPEPFAPPSAPEPIKPSNGSKPTVTLADLEPVGDVAAAPGFDDDDDLQIGEVSRVVNLKDLMKGSRSAKPAKQAAAPSALGRGSEAVQAFAENAQPASPLAHAASASLRDDVHHEDAPAGDVAAPLVPAARPARKSHATLFAAAGVLLIALVGLVIYLAAGSGSDDGDGNVGGAGGDVEGLALTIDDPRFPQRGRGSAAVADPAGTGKTGKTGTGRAGTGKTGGSVGSNQVTSNGSGAGTGKTEVVMGPDGPVEPLTPDDVIMQALKMSTGTQRCYSRALKDDPFLKVKSIAAVIAISRDGKVTEVSLDSMQTSVLGQCLSAAIKRWPFRKSTEGINTKITLKFEQSGF